MNCVDVTHAILHALADVHPRGIHAHTLAGMVHCEAGALSKELRLLKVTGAVHCASDTTEVSITDAAIAMLRHARSIRRH